MTNQIQPDFRKGERGNVLFLILIAVALFAALSYAVTQSTRSSGGNTSSETNLISSAQLTQYPAGVRTSVVRMLIGGVAVEDLRFNDPSSFAIGDANYTEFDTDLEQQLAVFHPRGGNATYQLAPNDVVTEAPAGLPNGTWFYNSEVQIQNIGLTDPASADGNDVVVWLPYISQGVCKRMNEELGIGATVPVFGSALTDTDTYLLNMEHDYVFPSGGGQIVIGDDADEADFIGQPFGCFQNGANGDFVYYHVLVER